VDDRFNFVINQVEPPTQSQQIRASLKLFVFVFVCVLFLSVNSSDLQSSNTWHSSRFQIEFDMQCQPANPQANQLQRDAKLSGSQWERKNEQMGNLKNEKLAPNYF